MRIAMISLHTCPLATLGGKDTGGMNVYVRELSRELGKRDIAVDVYTRSQNCHVPCTLWFGENVRVLHLVAGPEEPVDKNTLWQYVPEFAKGIARIASEQDLHYDVLHSHYWLSALAAQELRARGWNTPIVHMFHTLAALKEQVEGYEEDRRRLQTEREIVHSVEAIVAATPLDREHMVTYYEAPADRIFIIPPGVNLDLFHPIPQQSARLHVGTPCEPCEDSHVLLYVGRMDPMKGVDDLLRALPYVVQDLPPDWSRHTCLALIGGDAESSDESLRREMARLEKLKRELGIEQFATLLGRRDQDELPYYYASADLCIVPSHYESFGMVALESLACGTPVVASRVGGLTYIVEDGASGFLVPRGDPVALAHRISQLLDDCQLRRRMGLYGRETAREYAWPRIADRIVSLYNHLQAANPQLPNLPLLHQGDRILTKET